MLKKQLVIIIVLAGLLIVSCGTKRTLFKWESTLEKNWGRSYETAKYNQILNPDSNKNLDPVLGINGRVSDYNVEKYKTSFKEKESQEVVNILKLQ